jgi:predicted NBD/HSP70 family sugar kinase
MHGALSRGALADAVGLSRTTLSEITGELLVRGAIVVVDTDAADRSGSGRPAQRLALDPKSGQFMGVDFGHRRVRVAVADAAHEVIAAGVAEYSDDTGWGVRLEVAYELIERLSVQTGVHYGALHAIAVGVPGPYRSSEPETAAVGQVAVLVERAFHARFGAAVIVDNNTRFAALAEAIHAPHGAAGDVLYVRLSDGVGGGLVVAGRLVTGASGLAGEFGHVRVVDHGAACRCGKDGCLETIASVSAILAACREQGVAVETLQDLAVEARRAHPRVEGVLREVSAALGRVLASAAMTLNPAEVVIGGEIVRAAPTILDHVRATLRFELFSADGGGPEVRAAVLGDEGGALGAIAALFHQSPLLAGYPEATPVVERPSVPSRSAL